MNTSYLEGSSSWEDYNVWSRAIISSLFFPLIIPYKQTSSLILSSAALFTHFPSLSCFFFTFISRIVSHLWSSLFLLSISSDRLKRPCWSCRCGKHLSSWRHIQRHAILWDLHSYVRSMCECGLKGSAGGDKRDCVGVVQGESFVCLCVCVSL